MVNIKMEWREEYRPWGVSERCVKRFTIVSRR